MFDRKKKWQCKDCKKLYKSSETKERCTECCTANFYKTLYDTSWMNVSSRQVFNINPQPNEKPFFDFIKKKVNEKME